MTQSNGGEAEMGTMSAAESELWHQVTSLWDMTVSGDTSRVVDLLHPQYSGWVTGLDRTQNWDEAVRSVGPDTPRVLSYRLTPFKVTVVDGVAGIAHYCYEAAVGDGAGGQRLIRGRWSEIYLRKDNHWVMISVSGGPDGQR